MPGAESIPLALTVADLVKDDVPQPINISPMPGAGTVAGTRYVAEQPADGYTMLFIHGSPFQTAAMGLLNLDVPGEIEPIVQVADFCFGIFVAPDSPFDSISDLQAHAKEHPGELNAAGNVGSFSHTNMLRLQKLLGVEFNMVPIGGGGAATRAALISGEVDVIDQAAVGMPDVLRAGQAKGLVWYGDERDPNLPDIPTLTDEGFTPPPGMCTYGYLWGRADLPEEIKAYWAETITKALSTPEGSQAVLDKTSLPVNLLTGAEMRDEAETLADQIEADIIEFGLKRN